MTHEHVIALLLGAYVVLAVLVSAWIGRHDTVLDRMNERRQIMTRLLGGRQ